VAEEWINSGAARAEEIKAALAAKALEEAKRASRGFEPKSAVEVEVVVEEAPVVADTSSFGDEDEWDWGDD